MKWKQSSGDENLLSSSVPQTQHTHTTTWPHTNHDHDYNLQSVVANKVFFNTPAGSLHPFLFVRSVYIYNGE